VKTLTARAITSPGHERHHIGRYNRGKAMKEPIPPQRDNRVMDELHELPPPLRELLHESFTFASMYDIPPKLFSSLAPHRTCICEGYRIRDGLHQAFPELRGQSLIYTGDIVMERTGTGLPPNLRDFPDTASWMRTIKDFQGFTPLPPTKPVVGEPETFEDIGVMTQSAFGPASGEWILVVDDENDTFVGARSAADIVQFERVFGSAKDEAMGILGNWEAIKTRNPTWLRDWLPAVLEHVLGPDVTAELLADEGRWLAEL